MAQISGKRQDMAVDAVAVGGHSLLKRPYGKAMAEVVEPRSGFAAAAPEPGSPRQLDEHSGQGFGTDGSTPGENEHPVTGSRQYAS